MSLKDSFFTAREGKIQFEKGPDYRRLFGPLSMRPCEDCESIYSPAAYFVDLMRVIEEYITEPSGSNIPDQMTLPYRRPDLWEMELDCENTNEEMSYLRIANRVMEEFLRVNYLNGEDVKEYLASAVYPLTTPVNLPLLQIRTALGAFGVSLADIYAALWVEKEEIARESLGLSVEMAALLTGEEVNGAVPSLRELFGLYPNEELSSYPTGEILIPSKSFCEKTGLSPDQLNALIYQNLRSAPVTALAFNGKSAEVEIPNAESLQITGDQTIELWFKPGDHSVWVSDKGFDSQVGIVGKNYQGEGDLILFNGNVVYWWGNNGKTKQRFATPIPPNEWSHIAVVRDLSESQTLSCYLNGQLISEYAATFGSAGTTTSNFGIGKDNAGGAYLDGPVSEVRLWSVARTQEEIRAHMFTRLKGSEEGLNGYWQLSEGSGETVHDRSGKGNTGNLQSASGTAPQDYPQWISAPDLTMEGNELNATLVHDLFINQLLAEGQYLGLIAENPAVTSITVFDAAGQVLPEEEALENTLRRLNLFIRLANELQWPFADLDWAVRSLTGTITGDNPEIPLSNPEVVDGLDAIKGLVEKFELTIDQGCALWSDIKTIGRGNSPLSQALFDQVFNQPTSFYVPQGKSEAPPYHPWYNGNPLYRDTVQLWDPESESNQDQQFRSRLTAALKINDQDLSRIVAHLEAFSMLSDEIDPNNPYVNSETGTNNFWLNVENMSLLYRYALLPSILGLSVQDFLTLLLLIELPQIYSVTDVEEVIANAEWLKKAGITVPQLQFIQKGLRENKDGLVERRNTLAANLESLRKKAQSYLVTPQTFVQRNMDSATADLIFDNLVINGFVTQSGVVLHEAPINTENIYRGFVYGPATRRTLFPVNPQRKVLNFAQGQWVALDFDPFLDPQIEETNSFTLSLWVNPSTLTPDDYSNLLGSISLLDTHPFICQVENEVGKVRIGYRNLEKRLIFSDYEGFFVNEDEWVQVTWVNNKGGWTLYRNGEPLIGNPVIHSLDGICEVGSTGMEYAIGQNFQGQIMEVQIWNYPRSHNEIRDNLFTEPSDQAPGLIGYWPLETANTSGMTPDGTSPPHNGQLQITLGDFSYISDLPAEKMASLAADVLLGYRVAQNQLVIQQLASLYKVSVGLMEANVHLNEKRVPLSGIPVFNGENNYIKVPSTSRLATDSFSLSFKVFIGTNPGGESRPLVANAYQDSKLNTYGYAVLLNPDGSLTFNTAYKTVWVEKRYSKPLPANEWISVTAILEKLSNTSRMHLYVNGEVVGEPILNPDYQPYDPGSDGGIGLAIGANGSSGSYADTNFQGSIIEVQIWNTALSLNEAIQAGTNAGDVQADNLVAWWKLDHRIPPGYPVEPTIDDASGNGNTGTWEGPLDQGVFYPNHLLIPREWYRPQTGIYFEGLDQSILLSKLLGLNGREVMGFTDDPDAFGMPEIGPGFRFTLPDIRTIWEFEQMETDFGDTHNQLLLYFAQCPSSGSLDTQLLAEITGWEQEQIEILESQDFWPTGIDFCTVHGVWMLKSVFDIVETLGTNVDLLLSLRYLNDLPAAGTSDGYSNWDLYVAAEKAVQNTVLAQLDPSVSNEAIGALQENYRDILADLLIWELSETISGIHDQQELYEYLLVDIQMESNVEISPLKQGLDSLQLYVWRCFNHLEPGVINRIPKDWWRWMSSYRVWQVNREVFLYPENYVDPTLRKLQTPLFKDFVNTLSQGKLTNSNVVAGVNDYLDGLNELAKLKIVDSYCADIEKEIPGTSDSMEKKVLFLFGCTRTDPATFYYRKALVTIDPAKETEYTNSNLNWTPWQEVSGSIQSDYITPVYVFNKLFVFWVTQTTNNINTDPTATGESSTQEAVTTATINYIFQKTGGGWSGPQILKKDIVINIEGTDAEGFVLGPNLPMWQKVSVQPYSPGSNSEEQLLVWYGDMQIVGYTKITPPTEARNPDEKAFQNMYDRAKSFSSWLTNNNQSWHRLSLVPAMVLNSSLISQEMDFSLENRNSTYYNGVIIDNDTSTSLYTYYCNDFNNHRKPVPGLINFWSMEEGSDSSTVYDQVGSMDGTTNTGEDWAGMDGPAWDTQNMLSFDGGGQVMIDQGLEGLTDGLTLEAWVYCKSFEYNNQIFCNSDDGTNGFGLSISTEGYVVGEWWNGVDHFTNSAPAIKLNTWEHVAATYENGKIRVFLNGAPIVSDTDVGDMPAAGSESAIGGLTFDNGWVGASPFYTMNGYIFQLRAWNRVRTDEEIRIDFENTWSGLKPVLKDVQNPMISEVFNVEGQIGWIVFANGARTWLMMPNDPSLPSMKSISQVSSPKVGAVALDMQSYTAKVGFNDLNWSFLRLNSDGPKYFEAIMNGKGLDGLFTLPTQYVPEFNFDNYNPTNSNIGWYAQSYLDFNGPFGDYFWELFFYLPWYVGNSFYTARQFSIAKRWYEFIFNPTQQDGVITYWPLGPKTEYTLDGDTWFADLESGIAGKMNGNGTMHTGESFPSNPDRSVMEFGSGINVEAPPSPALFQPRFSLVAWVKPTADESGSSYNIIQSKNSGATQGYLLGYNNQEFFFKLGDGSGMHSIFTSTTFSLNEWYILVATYDGSYATLYVNGIQFPPEKMAYEPAIGQNFCIGSAYNNTNNFNGFIADVAYYNVALNEGQVLDLSKNYQDKRKLGNSWRFAPFTDHTFETKYSYLAAEDSAQLFLYEYDPFDPDAIANQRISAWQKGIFLNYIRNLITYGDALFTEDTWETLTEATMYYVLADNLLGKPPVLEEAMPETVSLTWENIVDIYADAGAPTGVEPVFLIETEATLAQLQVNYWETGTLPSLPEQVASILYAYFCVPSNYQLLKYWGVIADRLYKIHHGLNIDGEENDIPLYQPPINPEEMVQATGPGGGGMSSVNQGAVPVPYYRFSYLIQQAQAFANTTNELGNELLAALEKQDGANLALMQQNNSLAILNMNTSLRQNQITELQQTQQSLQAALANATLSYNTYAAWLAGGLNSYESSALELSLASLDLNILTSSIQMISSPLFLIPDIFGLADGGMQFGQSMAIVGQSFATIAGLMTQQSGILTQVGAYVRRSEEWNLQMQLAQNQINQIQAQIDANQTQIASAQQNLQINNTEIEQTQSIISFLQTKFTNEQLYSWMAGQVSSLYYQTYQLAWTLAQSAQTALQYELNSTNNYLNAAAWNDTYKGLTAGNSLMMSLQQMEQDYLNNNKRHLEIRKTISLVQIAPQAFLQLKESGSCQFSLSEVLFDLDFPGHFNRKIKTVSITIPAVVGPYQNINATLTQLSNAVLTQADISGVSYLMGLSGSAPLNGCVRTNWNPNQAIAISTGNQDSGLFELNFSDERYLPFEGTGAVSTWQLDLPRQANPIRFSSISDVIINLEYTADDGGSSFREAVTSLAPLQTVQGYKYLSLRQLFSSAWHAFLTSYELDFELLRDMFPVNLSNVELGTSGGDIYLVPLFAEGVGYEELPVMELYYNQTGSDAWDPQTFSAQMGPSAAPEAIDQGSPIPLGLVVNDIPSSLLLEDQKIDPRKWQDVVVVVPFSGDLYKV